jgi:hypothetical protein
MSNSHGQPAAPQEDLERYRPHNFCKEYELDVKRQKMPADDFAWESHYQIGPETLLVGSGRRLPHQSSFVGHQSVQVPAVGARFNARVRDYRRGIWGDSASFVVSGELGERNADVTVRERRRYTDLIRGGPGGQMPTVMLMSVIAEEPLVAKSVETVLQGLHQTHEGALRRVNGPASAQENGTGPTGGDMADSQNGTKSDQCQEEGPGTVPFAEFAPIFRTRLHDGFFCEGTPQVVFECQPIGQPAPEVTFFHHESAICEDGRHQISRHGNMWRCLNK